MKTNLKRLVTGIVIGMLLSACAEDKKSNDSKTALATTPNGVQGRWSGFPVLENEDAKVHRTLQVDQSSITLTATCEFKDSFKMSVSATSKAEVKSDRVIILENSHQDQTINRHYCSVSLYLGDLPYKMEGGKLNIELSGTKHTLNRM